QGPRRAAAADGAELRPAAGRDHGDDGVLSPHPCAQAGDVDLLHHRLRRAGTSQSRIVRARPARGPPQSARRFQQRRHRRDLERPPQRGAVPLDVRSLHADDQHAAGPLPLRRHPLVFDHVRPRWIDHRAADALVRSAHCARRAAAARRLSGQDRGPGLRRAAGQILHEMREGEMAALREVPFGLYYGSVDATPLFVMLAGIYAERTGDDAIIVELWPAIEAALAWIDGAGDPDGDGFLEYYRATERGLANQGWKDSQDAIFHADGR